CTPTKAAIASARVAQLARRAAEFGLKIPTIEVDFTAVIERAKKILMESRDGLREGFEDSDNPKLLSGHARLDGREDNIFRVRIDERQAVTAKEVVLDTGTRSLVPPIDGLDQVDFIHAENWLEKTDLPDYLAIIGGGYIGLEMSQFYRRMGSRVIIIEESGQIASHEDEDVARSLQQLLEMEGVAFRLNARVERVAPQDKGVTLTLKEGNISTEIEATHLFVATGRKPNTDELGLETVGVDVSERGIVKTDGRLATNVKGIWAAGDIRGGP